MQWRTIATVISLGGLVAAFGYAWWYDRHPRPPPASPVVVVGSGSAIVVDAGVTDAAATTATATIASTAMGAGADAAIAGSSTMHARVQIGDAWLDITTTGPSASELCGKLAARQL